MFSSLELERAEGIARLTLNRPEVLNAFHLTMIRELNQALERVSADRQVRVVVLTGAGRAFCAGADLRALKAEADVPWALRQLTTAGHQAIAALKALPQPVIAAVNGVAAGGGLGLVLACDLAVASASARLTPAFVKLGLSPDYSNSYHLVRLLGEKKAFELCAFSPVLAAEEAQALGLVNRVVPADRLDEEVNAWARRLASGPRHALSRTKRLIQQSGGQPLLAQLEAESLSIVACGQGEEFREGWRAFLEKRPPRFPEDA